MRFEVRIDTDRCKDCSHLGAEKAVRVTLRRR